MTGIAIARLDSSNRHRASRGHHASRGRASAAGALGIALVLLVLVFPGLAAADNGDQLIAVLQGNANPMPTEDPCVLINEESATALVWTLGQMQFRSREVVNFCTNPDGADIEGEFTLTAPNGDRIEGTYRTVGEVDPAANEITAVGRFRITNGTGRFAAVRGKGALAAIGSLLPPFEFAGGMFGKITY